MSIDVRVVREWGYNQIRVLVRDIDNGIIFGREGPILYSDLPHGHELPPEAWLLEIPEQFFELILGKLTELDAGEKPPGDAYALRRDLDREKARVDQLLAVLIDQLQREPTVTTVLQGPQGPMGPVGPPGRSGPPKSPLKGPF